MTSPNPSDEYPITHASFVIVLSVIHTNRPTVKLAVVQVTNGRLRGFGIRNSQNPNLAVYGATIVNQPVITQTGRQKDETKQPKYGGD